MIETWMYDYREKSSAYMRGAGFHGERDKFS